MKIKMRGSQMGVTKVSRKVTLLILLPLTLPSPIIENKSKGHLVHFQTVELSRARSKKKSPIFLILISWI